MVVALKLTIVQRLFACRPLLVNSRLSQRLYCIVTIGPYIIVPTVLCFALCFKSLISNHSTTLWPFLVNSSTDVCRMNMLQYAGLCFMPYILITGELMTVPTALFADDCLRFIQLTKYSLEPRVVFQIWRPVINESLMKHWFPKTGTKVCTRYACVFRVFCSVLRFA